MLHAKQHNIIHLTTNLVPILISNVVFSIQCKYYNYFYYSNNMLFDVLKFLSFIFLNHHLFIADYLNN